MLVISSGLCPGNEDHICNATDVTNERKFPDISECRFYFKCLYPESPPIRQPCEPGKVFDIDLEDCIEIAAGFICEYRCHTTGTTGFTTAITSQTTTGTTLTFSFPQSSIDTNLTAQTTTFRPVEETTTTQSTTSSTSSTSSSSSTSSTSTTGSTITTVSPNGRLHCGIIDHT